MNAPPSRPKVPGALGLLAWMWNPTKNMDRMFATYGDLYTVDNPLLGKEVVLNHPELVKQALTGDRDTYLAGEVNAALSPILGETSILVLTGDRHHRARKLLMPPFHGERMTAYGAVMREASERVALDLPRGERFSLRPHLQRITFDVILKAVFGLTDSREIEELRAALEALLERAQSPLGMLWMLPALQRDLGPLTGWRAIVRLRDAADRLLFSIISRARAKGTSGGDILSMLLAARDEAGEPMTDQELRDELVTLLFAGHETTSTALSWALDEIVRRPEIHDRIVAEARAVTDVAAPQPFLDAAVQETLRLHPPAALLARKLAKPIQLREWELPAGMFVVPCTYLVQRHPDYWDAPSEFRPERFLEKKHDPYAWIPFGAGERRCIGMAFARFEMRVVLATLLQRVPIRLVDRPAAVTLRSFLLAPAGGPRAFIDAAPSN